MAGFVGEYMGCWVSQCVARRVRGRWEVEVSTHSPTKYRVEVWVDEQVGRCLGGKLGWWINGLVGDGLMGGRTSGWMELWTVGGRKFQWLGCG